MYNPLRTKIKADVEDADLSRCPICKQEMIKAKIHKGRDTYVCPKHFIVAPVGKVTKVS